MLKKIKIALILTVVLFLGLSINVSANTTEVMSENVPSSVISAYNSEATSTYKLDDNKPYFYFSFEYNNETYYILGTISDTDVSTLSSLYDNYFENCYFYFCSSDEYYNSTKGHCFVYFLDCLTDTSYSVGARVYDSSYNVLYYNNNANYYIPSDMYSYLLANGGDVTGYTNCLYNIRASDKETILFHLLPLMITDYLAAATLTPEAVQSSIAETLTTVIPMILLVFSALLSPFLIRYLISRLQ